MPGPVGTDDRKENISDGTSALQRSSRPAATGKFHDFELAVESVYGYLSRQASDTWIIMSDGSATLITSGVSVLDMERALIERYGQAAVQAADRYLRELVGLIKNAVDWKTLNHVAAPLLGPSSTTAGILYGLTEGLAGDVGSLLGLLKMVVLAGLYVQLQHPGLRLAADPLSVALLIAARSIPSLAGEAKAADEQLCGILEEVWKIAKHPIDFISAVGKSIGKQADADWKQLKAFSADPTIANDFQAGRILGRSLYQIVMAILLVISVAGAVAKLAAKFPALLRLARIVRGGGALGELEGTAKAAGSAGKIGGAAEDVAVAETRKVPTPAPRPEHGLPATTEESVADKLDRYLLNPEHPEGGTKAQFFERALGYTKENPDGLAKQLVFDQEKAIQTDVTQYGTKYNQTIDVLGANGRTVPIKTAWIRNNDGVVRLITAVPEN